MTNGDQRTRTLVGAQILHTVHTTVSASFCFAYLPLHPYPVLQVEIIHLPSRAKTALSTWFVW